jgi:hypothetical protein
MGFCELMRSGAWKRTGVWPTQKLVVSAKKKTCAVRDGCLRASGVSNKGSQERMAVEDCRRNGPDLGSEKSVGGQREKRAAIDWEGIHWA